LQLKQPKQEGTLLHSTRETERLKKNLGENSRQLVCLQRPESKSAETTARQKANAEAIGASNEKEKPLLPLSKFTFFSKKN